MLSNILVPLDGSHLAEVALPYARALARRTGGSLTLVRAAHYASLLGDVATDQYRAIQRAEHYLAQMLDRLATDGVHARAGVPFGGSAADWIVEESEFRHADLIVMATHDRVGPDRWLHGSVAEAVVHHSTIPVMLVPSSNTERFVRRFGAEQPALIVPLDGSDLAESALPVARELAQPTGARVVLVAVVPKSGQLLAGQGGAIVTYTPAERERLEVSVRVYLEEIARQFAGGATRVDVEVRSGDAVSEIAAAALDYAAAAVVMATHGRSGVLRTLLGSVAGGVLHASNGPVVLVRAPVAHTANEPAEQPAAAPAD